MLTVRVEDEKLRLFLGKITPKMRGSLGKEIRKQSRALRDYIVVRHLTGGTSADRLATPSGHLIRSTTVLPVKSDANRISGGVGFGAKYARVHIGHKGQRTTIRPINAKMLAIPLPPAKTAAGAARYKSPLDVPDLHFIRSKAGNLLLAKFKGKGSKRGIIPWFVLKKQVMIPARVHLRDILTIKKAEISQGIQDAIPNAIKRK